MRWDVDILTLFPEIFPGPLGVSLAGRALKKEIWSLKIHNLRQYGLGRHRAIDDSPFGGGAGMVMRPDVIQSALDDVISISDKRHVIYPTPRGRLLKQKDIAHYASSDGVVILCGRFEGVDQRVLEKNDIEEVCLSDFILSGGEIAALALLDGCIRLLPHVMGSENSAKEESFSEGLLEYPHYTRPAQWQDCKVPDILLSGNHQKIQQWRYQKSCEITRLIRPDLWENFQRSHQDS